MTLSLEILTQDGPVVQADVVALRAVDLTGSFGLLPGHEDFCTALVPSILLYREVNGGERYVAVDGGVLLLEDGAISVVTRDAVVLDTIDHASEAAAALLRNRGEHEQEASKAFSTLVAELLRQLPQLEVRR